MTNIQIVLTLIIDNLNNSVSGGRGLPETVNISSFSAVQVIRVTFSWQGVLNVKLLNILPPIFFKNILDFQNILWICGKFWILRNFCIRGLTPHPGARLWLVHPYFCKMFWIFRIFCRFVEFFWIFRIFLSIFVSPPRCEAMAGPPCTVRHGDTVDVIFITNLLNFPIHFVFQLLPYFDFVS